MLRDHWLWGVGEGRFRVEYNNHQAAYFSLEGIDKPEMLWADNTFYAFNDLWQVLVENGVIGLMLFLPVLVQLFRSMKYLDNKNKAPIVVAAVAMLLCFGGSSLFFYSFHVMPVCLLSILCLAIASRFTGEKHPFQSRTTYRAWLVGVYGGLLFHYYAMVRYEWSAGLAKKLAGSGFYNKALEIYRSLVDSYLREGKTEYDYATLLYKSRELHTAKKVIAKALAGYTIYELHILAGRVAQELGQKTEAEHAYIKAVHMVPNRMRSRQEILHFYLETGDTANAILWCRLILNMRIKVASKSTELIRKETRLIYEKISGRTLFIK